jgi:hypothetical protein
MSSQTNLLEQLESTVRFATNAISRKSNAGRFPERPGYLHQVLRVMDRGRRVAMRTLEGPGPVADSSGYDFCLPLVQKLVQIRQSRLDGGLFTFVSVSAGAGGSYVAESVAWELSRRTRERVLIASAASINGLVPTHFREMSGHAGTTDSSGEGAPKVWRLAETYYDSELVPPNFHSQSVELLRRWFAYVLVECPDVREMAAPWQITSLSDGVLLVVGAGLTKRSEIAQARELLDASSVKTLGLILNKRTQPIPPFIYRYL